MRYKYGKSYERHGQEIDGKSRIDAEKHLIKWGFNPAGAAAAVARVTGTRSQTVIGLPSEIAKVLLVEGGQQIII